MSCCKDALVVDYSEVSSNFHPWNINFLRAAHGWEVDSFTSFFNLLYSFNFRQGGEDNGYLPRKSCLMLNPTTMSLFPMLVLFSLGGAFRGIKIP
jgi:hypothetical protein